MPRGGKLGGTWGGLGGPGAPRPFGAPVSESKRCVQNQQTFANGIATAQGALPELAPYIAAEGAEGAAYHALPTPPGAVLTPVTNVVTNLNNQISQVTLPNLQPSLNECDTHTSVEEEWGCTTSCYLPRQDAAGDTS